MTNWQIGNVLFLILIQMIHREIVLLYKKHLNTNFHRKKKQNWFGEKSNKNCCCVGHINMFHKKPSIIQENLIWKRSSPDLIMVPEIKWLFIPSLYLNNKWSIKQLRYVFYTLISEIKRAKSWKIMWIFKQNQN